MNKLLLDISWTNLTNRILRESSRSKKIQSSFCLVRLSWLEGPPVDGKVAGSIPGQGIYPSCGLDSRLERNREGHQLMFLSL